MPRQRPLCLIVDDEPDTCWALEHVLRKAGLDTRRAMRAEQALREIRESRFRVALLDAKLPDMDGLELARRIRASDADLCIIVVSGYFYQDDAAIQEAKAQGVIQDFIGKPFLHEEILRVVSKGLAERVGGPRALGGK